MRNVCWSSAHSAVGHAKVAVVDLVSAKGNWSERTHLWSPGGLRHLLAGRTDRNHSEVIRRAR